MTTWPVLLGWALGWVLLWRIPGLVPAREAGHGPSVSVVIPARDEDDRLPTLLEALSRQDRPADQVVVVDDESSDDTVAVAETFASSLGGLEVVRADPLPQGWAGKPWACATGADRARGDLLVFLDCDVDLGPGALGSLVATVEADRGLVSVQPRHDVGRPAEALSLPFNVVSVMGLGFASLVPPRRQWGASGPCLATRRSDYDRVGGHRAVAPEIAEDLALARRYGDEGLPVTCRGGGDLVRYRMYRDVRGLVEGWSKNIVTGARRTPLLRAAVIAGWITALLVLASRLVERPTTAEEALGWLLAYTAGAAQLGLLGRRVGRFGPAAVLWPLLLAFFLAVFVLSAVRTLVLREVRWSGRRIPSPGR